MLLGERVVHPQNLTKYLVLSQSFAVAVKGPGGAGKTQLLGAAAEQFYKLLLALACHIVGNPTSAEDIVQEALEKAWKNLQGFPPSKIAALHVKAWLCRIVVRTALNHRDKERRLVSLESIGGGALPLVPGSKFDQPEAALLRAETLGLLAGALAALPPKQQIMVSLRYLYGYRLEEIALLLTCPLGTVKGTLHRALRSMREVLLQQGITQEDQANGWNEHVAPLHLHHLTLSLVLEKEQT